MVKIKLLYVDDDPDLRDLVALSLTMDPTFSVQVADGGETALAMLADDTPDLVLLDVMMPGMDGPAVFARMQAVDALAKIPVVFLTARVLPEERKRLSELGARGILAKPFDPATLAAEVRQMLS